MRKGERVLVAVFLCLAWPLSLFVLAVFGGNLLSAPEWAIILGAFVGLGAGILLVAFRLKRLVVAFYAVGRFLTVPAYLLWSAVVLAFFMGLPVGNLVLGFLAGVYVGRKAHHAQAAPDLFEKRARNAGLLTATITGLIALAMGLLAIGEQRTMQTILSLVGLGGLAATASGRAILVTVAVPVVVALQYGLTRLAASWSYRIGREDAGGTPA